MAFRVSTTPVTAGGQAGEAVVLESDDERAEVWPSHGFNCLRWQVRQPDGSWGDLLYTAPDWETNPVPTRSGHPILFPFPNRLRAGSFQHASRAYHLALNESSGKHAIHGFTPRRPWRVIASGAAADSAFVTGEFRLSTDAPDAVWPADGTLIVTYQLSATTMRVEATVAATGGRPFPFGLGYHPYFRIPGGPELADDMRVTCRAGGLWELDAGVPTGRRMTADGPLDFREPKRVGDLALDHLFTALDPAPPGVVAELRGDRGSLSLWASAGWREVLLFTPPHRRAVAIEPYTCASNAANLPDAGWRVLKPGEAYAPVVEYRYQPNG